MNCAECGVPCGDKYQTCFRCSGMVGEIRAMKVRKLIRTLRSAADLVNPQATLDQVADMAESFRDREWKALELLAKVNECSETTRELVKAQLRELANDRTRMGLEQKKGWEL